MNSPSGTDTLFADTSDADQVRTDSNKDYREHVFSEEWKKHKSPEYLAYRDLWDKVGSDYDELDYPLNVDIETTTICNLHCPMCSRTLMVESGEIDPKDAISREDYSLLVDQAAAMGTKAIKLNYNGEPLAHKDVVWQVEYAKKQGILDVIMNTNGTLLRKGMGEELLEAGLDGLFISVDAASPELYEEQRPGGDLGQVMTNTYAFLKYRNEHHPGCQLRLSMVMHPGEKWRSQFEALRVIWAGLVDALGYSPYVDFEDYLNKPLEKIEGWACSQPFQRLTCKLNGNATVCCADNWDVLKVGNWRTDRLQEMWKSEKFVELRRQHREGNYDKVDLCRKCHFPYMEMAM